MTVTELQTQIPGYITGAWVIDPVHSEVGFSVRHLMLSKVRGRFAKFDGRIVTPDNPLDASVEATIDLSSIDTNNPDRDAHLRSADFFDVERHPVMTYRSTGVRVVDDEFLVDGELSLHGITRPVTLTLRVEGILASSPFGDTRVRVLRPTLRSTAATSTSTSVSPTPAVSASATESRSPSRSKPSFKPTPEAASRTEPPRIACNPRGEQNIRRGGGRRRRRPDHEGRLRPCPGGRYRGDRAHRCLRGPASVRWPQRAPRGPRRSAPAHSELSKSDLPRDSIRRDGADVQTRTWCVA